MRLLVTLAVVLAASRAVAAPGAADLVTADAAVPAALSPLAIGMPFDEARRAVPGLAGPADALALEMPVPGVRDAWYRVGFDEGTRRIDSLGLRFLASPVDALTAKLGAPRTHHGVAYWLVKDRRIVARRDMLLQGGDLRESWFVDLGAYQPLAAQLATLRTLLGATRAQVAKRSVFGVHDEAAAQGITLHWIDLPPTEWEWGDAQRWFVRFDARGRVVELSTTVDVPAASELDEALRRLFGKGAPTTELGSAATRYRRGKDTAIVRPFGGDGSHHDVKLRR